MKDEMDILREVGSISAGHGSIALSEILGRKIEVEMPSLDIVPAEIILEKIPSDQIVISVSSTILSGLKGSVLFVLSEKSAFKLTDMCSRVRPEDKKYSMFTEMGLSVIKEIGNVIISSYVGALSMILKTIIIPSIPTLLSGSVAQALNLALAPYSRDEYVLLTEAVFSEPGEKITGSFYLVLNGEAMKEVQKSCKQMLEAIKSS